jgi:hypothetical protein
MTSGFIRVCVCCLLAAPAAAAQEAINFASVSGRVTDPSLAVVPGALVTARQTDTNVTAETTTGADGRFRFPYLKVGRYELKAHLAGFADATRALTLTVGGAYDVPIALAVEGLSADVTVAADAAIVEASRSQIAATVTLSEAQALPMRSRNFLDLALLVPGVSPANVASTQLFAETSAVPGAGLSIGSQRNFSNNFIVDGLSANDDAAGLSGMPYGVDAIDQFQVVTSGGQAELGRALGGYVNVVTRSGTNVTHGDGYEFLRDDSLNAANALTGTTLPMHQDLFGGSLGGPLVRNRTFYFANVEHRALTQSGLTTICGAPLPPGCSTDYVALINPRLAAVSYPGSPIATGEYPNPVENTTWFGKLEHQVSAGDQLSIRYSQYGVTSQNSRGAGGLNAATASAALDNADRSVSFGNTASLSARTVNETRAQVVWSDLQAPPSDPVGPAVSIAGVASFGTLSGSPTRRQNTLYELVDTLSHQRGAHALRAGVDLMYNDDTITFPRAVRGSYAFSNMANFLAGAYNNAGFSQTFGESVVAQTNPNVGIFAQDEWKLRPNVTVNAGVRYDLQFLETIRTDTNNVAPRVGVAWTPRAGRELVVRGSAGVFYDRVPLRALANALLSAGNTADVSALRQVGVSLSPGQAGAPVFPNILAAPIASVTLPNLTTMDRAMQNAYSRQASFEVEQRLGVRTTVSAGYQYVSGNNLLVSVNQNVPSCVAAGTNNGCRPVSAYASNSQYSPLGASTYHGLHLSLVQRPTRWGAYRVSYTLSKAMNNVGEFFFSSPIDPFDLSKDWGRSDDDQRHRLVVNGNVNVLTLQVGGTLQYYSALPLNITSGVTTIQATAGRPLANGAPSSSVSPPDAHTSTFVPRNSGDGPDSFTVNLRVSRVFAIGSRARLEALGEVFNVTNRANVVTLNGNFGAGSYPASPSSTFGQVTAVGDPRAFQLALKARF